MLSIFERGRWYLPIEARSRPEMTPPPLSISLVGVVCVSAEPTEAAAESISFTHPLHFVSVFFFCFVSFQPVSIP